MTALPLRLNQHLHSARSDFGVRVRGNELEVPKNVAEVLTHLRVHNGFELVNLLFTFPTSLAEALGWHLSEVEEARGKLVKQLDGKLPSALLHPPVRKPRATGALDPRRLAPMMRDSELPEANP